MGQKSENEITSKIIQMCNYKASLQKKQQLHVDERLWLITHSC
jgi:hypothetical protein